MAIAILNELQDRLHTCAVAGTGIMSEDFRLKKTAEQFEEFSKSSPVLSKLSQQVNKLISPELNEKERASLLIDTITLVDAIVITQADYKIPVNISGDSSKGLESIELTGDKRICTAKYSALTPLYTALTTKGSGRYEIIRSAIDEKSQALDDFRLKPALINALGDSYSEISEMVANFLIRESTAIIPLLKRGFDKKGKRDMARRVQIISKIAGVKENDFYISLLEESDNLVKEEAIKALRCDNINTDLLIGLIQTEKGNMKKTAISSLSSLTTSEAESFVLKTLEKSPLQTLPYVRMSTSDAVSDMVADKLDELSGEFLKLKKDEHVTDEQYNLVNELISSVMNKTSPKMIQTLEMLAKNEKALSKVKTKNGVSPFIRHYQYSGNSGKNPLNSRINQSLISGLVIRGDEKIIEFTKKLEASYPAAGLIAELLSPNEKSFEKYGKNIDEETVFAFRHISCEMKTNSYEITMNIQISPESYESFTQKIGSKIDIRWFEELTKDKYSKLDMLSMLSGLINPSDEKSIKILRKYFIKQVENGEENSVQALKRCGYEDFAGMLPKHFKARKKTNYYDIIYAYRTVRLPKETLISELEEIAQLIEKGKIKTTYKTDYLKQQIQRIKDGEEI